MIGGVLVGGKSYTLFEYLQVLVITGGVVVFNFGGKKKKTGQGDSAFGLGLILFSLVMDAVTGGLQDKVKKSTAELNPDADSPKPTPTMHESMLYTNASGCLVAGGLALATGQLMSGADFCLQNPEVMKALIIYSFASAVGQNFIYYTITQFNPLVLTTVTTTRKIFTTVYSVFRNPSNRLSGMQWGGCGLVFVGLLLDIVEQAVCPKKKKSPPKPPVDEEEEKMQPLKSAADEDDHLEELERQNRPLLEKEGR